MTSTSFNVGLADNTKLSSRVLRPPGGGHTDIFGGEAEPPRGRRPAPSVVAATADDMDTKVSSRGPPGGGQCGHTDLFGGNSEPPRGRRPAPSAFAAQEAAEAKANGTSEAPQNGQATQPQEPPSQLEPKHDSPAKPEIPAKLDSPVKPDSPKQESTQPETAKVDPPKRVRVPPGGFSSGLW